MQNTIFWLLPNLTFWTMSKMIFFDLDKINFLDLVNSDFLNLRKFLKVDRIGYFYQYYYQYHYKYYFVTLNFPDYHRFYSYKSHYQQICKLYVISTGVVLQLH